MKPKLKSQIPWNNFCMRKYSTTIAAEIRRIGVKQAKNTLLYRGFKKLNLNIKWRN